MNWLPINAAPKMDGREVLVCWQSGHMSVIHLDQRDWKYYATRSILYYAELQPPKRDADTDWLAWHPVGEAPERR